MHFTRTLRVVPGVKVQTEPTSINAHLTHMAMLEESLRELLRDGIPRSSGPIATTSRRDYWNGSVLTVSSSWIAVVDRGGLLHISDDLYRVFYAM